MPDIIVINIFTVNRKGVHTRPYITGYTVVCYGYASTSLET